MGYGETEGSSAWTGNQTSLTGSNSINVKVKNHTQLDGAVLGNIKEDGTDGNNFNLSTKTFGFSDLQDHDKEKSSYVGLTVGFGSSENSSGERQTSGSFGIDAQYSSHNKQQNTFATLGNGNITIQSDIDNGTNSLAGINRDVTESQIITKDKSRNYDVYVNSETISTLTDKDKRDQLVANIKDPSRIVGQSLAFGEIVNSLDDAVDTIKNGEIKAPTNNQLKHMSQEEQNAAWAQYHYDKENQGVIKASTAEKFDNSVKDYAVAVRQTVIGINHDGELNLLGTGAGNNLKENFQRVQDGRYETLTGRANLSNQIQYIDNDGNNKDGVDILNNATAYSVTANQGAMQFFVDGMSGRTDLDALLYAAPGAGLANNHKGVAVVNKASGTNIVGVNIDNTDLKNHSDFITTIAEETRHITNPDDHNANQYAAQAAYVWREENIKEGRKTGQGVGIEQWRNDNRNDATILKNNERIGSQRVADMEFRQLNLRDASAMDQGLYAISRSDLSENQKQEAIDQLKALACAATRCAAQLPEDDKDYKEMIALQMQGEALVNQGYSVNKTLNMLGVETRYEEQLPTVAGLQTATYSLFSYSIGDQISDFAARNFNGFNAGLNKFEDLVLSGIAAGLILDVNPTTGMIAPENQRMAEELTLSALDKWNTPYQSDVGNYMTNSWSASTWQDSPNYVLDTTLNGLDIVPLAGAGVKALGKGLEWAGDLLKMERKVDENLEQQFKSDIALNSQRPDFYVGPLGPEQTLPATGYRYMRLFNDDGTVNQYALKTLDNDEAPVTFFGFEKYDSGIEAREAFQVRGPEFVTPLDPEKSWSDARLRGDFDTLQLYENGGVTAYIPKWNGNKHPTKLEPFAEAYPQYGQGGAWQMHADNQIIKFDNLEILPESKLLEKKFNLDQPITDPSRLLKGPGNEIIYSDNILPNPQAANLLTNPPARFTERVNDIECVDCDDLARDLYKVSGNQGRLLDLTVPNGEIKVYEMGKLESFIDHRIYTDGNYVFDPRLSSKPIPIEKYVNDLKALNPTLVIRDVTPD